MYMHDSFRLKKKFLDFQKVAPPVDIIMKNIGNGLNWTMV